MVEERILPVMALSYEAFLGCIEDRAKVIYLDMDVYMENAEEIYRVLGDNGYDTSGYPAKRGVFFSRGIEIEPCKILHFRSY